MYLMLYHVQGMYLDFIIYHTHDFSLTIIPKFKRVGFKCQSTVSSDHYENTKFIAEGKFKRMFVN